MTELCRYGINSDRFYVGRRNDVAARVLVLVRYRYSVIRQRTRYGNTLGASVVSYLLVCKRHFAHVVFALLYVDGKRFGKRAYFRGQLDIFARNNTPFDRKPRKIGKHNRRAVVVFYPDFESRFDGIRRDGICKRRTRLDLDRQYFGGFDGKNAGNGHITRLRVSRGAFRNGEFVFADFQLASARKVEQI